MKYTIFLTLFLFLSDSPLSHAVTDEAKPGVNEITVDLSGADNDVIDNLVRETFCELRGIGLPSCTDEQEKEVAQAITKIKNSKKTCKFQDEFSNADQYQKACNKVIIKRNDFFDYDSCIPALSNTPASHWGKECIQSIAKGAGAGSPDTSSTSASPVDSSSQSEVLSYIVNPDGEVIPNEKPVDLSPQRPSTGGH